MSWVPSPDGCPIITDKVTLLHALEKPSYVLLERPEDVTTVVDAGGLLHSLSTYPETFEELARLVLEMMPKSSRVDFVCDLYVLHSSKGIERKSRGMGQRITVKKPLQKVPSDFKDFLSNDGNKADLYNLILKECTTTKYAEKIQRVIWGGEVTYELTSDGRKVNCVNVEELLSNHVSILKSFLVGPFYILQSVN